MKILPEGICTLLPGCLTSQEPQILPPMCCYRRAASEWATLLIWSAEKRWQV